MSMLTYRNNCDPLMKEVNIRDDISLTLSTPSFQPWQVGLPPPKNCHRRLEV
jgi:hypothetical protein